MSEENLGTTLIDGIFNPSAEDAAIDLAQFEIGSFLEDDSVLKEIPLIKIIIACKKTWTSFHDYLFLKKIAAFITASPRFSEIEIENFVVDHWRGEEAKRLGETIVLLLDRFDDTEKPKMLAKVFAAFIRKQITYDSFRRLASGIDLASIQDLKTLAGETSVSQNMIEPYPQGLVRSGFAQLQLKNLTYNGHSEFDAKIGALGTLFKKCILCDF